VESLGARARLSPEGPPASLRTAAGTLAAPADDGKRRRRTLREDARMPERPEVIATLEGLLAAMRVAHERIYDLHRELVAAGTPGRSEERLQESARIALELAPQLAERARRLRAQWSEESLLDPEQAEGTAGLLAAEVHRIEPELRALLRRQAEIARELRRELG
jgi:hypothetical protein